MPHYVSHPTSLDRVEHLFGLIDGSDLDASLDVARALIAEGRWRQSMVRRFIRLHRGEVSRLMRRLGPIIPPNQGGPRRNEVSTVRAPSNPVAKSVVRGRSGG